MDGGGYVQVQMDFLEACSAGDIKKTTALLSSGYIDSNFHHHVNGWTGLHWAARRGHVNIVNLLLQAGFDADLKAKDGKTAMDVALDQSVKELIQQFQKTSDLRFSSDNTTMLTLDANSSLSIDSPKNHSDETNGLSDTNQSSPNRSQSSTPKHSPPYKKSRTGSNDFTNSPPSPESPTTPTRKQQEIYSYGRRDSLDRTRFLLVRTRFIDHNSTENDSQLNSMSSGNGKEAFRRVTLPGGGSVDFMKLTIERAMRMGHVLQVLILPDRTPIETDEQLRTLANSQKVEVIFEEGSKGKNPRGVRKGSLPERTYNGGAAAAESFVGKSHTKTSYRIQKAFSVNENEISMADAAGGDHLPSDAVNENLIGKEDSPPSVALVEPSEFDGAEGTDEQPSNESSVPVAEVETSFTDKEASATEPAIQSSDLSLNIELLPAPDESLGPSEATPTEGIVEEDKQPENEASQEVTEKETPQEMVENEATEEVVEKEPPQKVELHEEEAEKENKEEIKLKDSAATPPPSESPVHLEGGENQSHKISGDFSVVSTTSESNFNDDNNNNNDDETKVELKDDGTSTPVPAESVVVENTKPAQQEEPQENISIGDNTKNEVEVEHADEKDANIVAEAVAAAVLANGINELKDSGKDVPQEKTEVIHQPEGDSKTKKLLNSIVGDENDPYRSLKIAVLVAGVVSVSGGIAYYFFVRVK